MSTLWNYKNKLRFELSTGKPAGELSATQVCDNSQFFGANFHSLWQIPDRQEVK